MRSRQRGVALLVALLVVALAVILVAALLDRGELALARTRNVLRGEQAEAYALGLDTYAAQVLALTHSTASEPDTNASPWATPLPAQPVPGGVIAASMRDLNGCFNLNNLAPGNPVAWESAFEGLLKALQLDVRLRTAVVNWLTEGQASGNDSNFYLAQPVPYRAHGGLFAHVSELRLVRGVTSEVYARLAPHVCALPPGTRININTATVPVLMALLPGATQAAAESLWQNGTAHGNTDEFKQRLAPLGLAWTTLLARQITDKSSYFLLRGDIVLDEVPFTTWSLLEYRQGGGVHVLARSRGSDEALVVATPGIAPPAAPAL